MHQSNLNVSNWASFFQIDTYEQPLPKTGSINPTFAAILLYLDF